jgi:hypothetical protein
MRRLEDDLWNGVIGASVFLTAVVLVIVAVFR